MRGRRVGSVVALVLLLAGSLVACGDGDATSTPEELLVAAASDLRPAFELLGARFEEETGVRVTFDFGSSGQLAQRIVEGAPVDLFASADAGFVDQVLAADVGDAATRTTYAFGRIVLWSATDRWRDWPDLAAVAADDGVVTIAIANPEHAPYGAAAEQALVAAGVLDDVRDRLVLGENISDTQRLVATGNADVGLVARSLALASDERGEGRWVPIDDDLHDPLVQDLVVTARDPARADLARDLVSLIAGEEGREVMGRYGFRLPGEDGAP